MPRVCRRHRIDRGSSVLYTIVLSPILMLCMALAIEAGALQLQKARFQSAADVATAAASSQISASSGSAVYLDAASAEAAARQALTDNLEPLAPQIAGSSVDGVAGSADIVTVTEVPAANPFDPAATLDPAHPAGAAARARQQRPAQRSRRPRRRHLDRGRQRRSPRHRNHLMTTFIESTEQPG